MDVDLNRYTEHELIELNHRVVERIRFLRRGRCQETMAAFNVGDRVSFRPPDGNEVSGTVVRLNTKSITVVSHDGIQWRVGPTLLTKMSTERDHREGTVASDKNQGELIDLTVFQHRDRRNG